MAHLPPAVEERLNTLPDGLREHIERVRAEASTLASRHALDAERVDLAAAAHDLFRAVGDEEMLREARRYRLHIQPAEDRMPLFLHGPVAASWLQREAGVSDEAVLEAVRVHTIGRKGMGSVAKAVYLADKLDPQKEYRYRWIREVRVQADKSLDRALLLFLDRSLNDLAGQGAEVHPDSIELQDDLAAAVRSSSKELP